MADLIDRQALIKKVNEAYARHYEKSRIQCLNDFYRCVWRKIFTAQAVDAEPVKHGRWMDNMDENGMLCNAWRKCSFCGGLNFSKRPPYCPNCGAKMDLEG